MACSLLVLTEKSPSHPSLPIFVVIVFAFVPSPSYAENEAMGHAISSLIAFRNDMYAMAPRPE